MSELESYYLLLQVDPAADPEIIESAYRRLSRKYHPDLNSSPDAAERMGSISQAYATLSNPGRRAIYDRQLRQAGIRQRLAALRPEIQRPAPPISIANIRAQVEQYRISTEPLSERAARAMGRWAAQWAEGLDRVISGDPRGKQRIGEAGQLCIDELTECLTHWEQLSPPAAARRLADLGAACFKLEVALVRGTLSFAEASDFSVLQPLAGLSDRIESLTRTIAAETVVLSRPAA